MATAQENPSRNALYLPKGTLAPYDGYFTPPETFIDVRKDLLKYKSCSKDLVTCEQLKQSPSENSLEYFLTGTAVGAAIVFIISISLKKN